MSRDWSFACPDWEARLRDGRPPIADLPLDAAAAARAVKVYNKLRLPDVPGQPLMAEAGSEWFRAIVRAIFGSVDAESGERRVPEVFCLVPKKNSKTTNSAALGLVLLLLNERPNAEGLIVGPTQEVADLCFMQAKGMVEADDYLRQRFHVQEHLKQITCRVTRARLKIKSFDMRVMTGTKPIFVIVDELHIMSTFSYAARVLGQIRGGLMPNPESVLIMITTQSDTPPAGVFRAELEMARRIRDGKVAAGARMLPVLYEFPAAMQTDEARLWRDPANWPMVLPNLGRSISLDRLRADYTGARERGLAEEIRWASQHLNVEIGLALHGDRWVGADLWQAAAEPGLGLDELLDRSEVCVVGIDGGGQDDLLGLGVIGRCRETRRWLHWARAWAQEEAMSRRPQIASTLRDFARDGDLVVCEDPTQDIVEIADLVERLRAAGRLPERHAVGLDPYMVAQLVDELASRGIDGDQVIGIGQGAKLSPAIWGLERKLKDGTFLHGGQRLMAFSVGNAKVEQRGNAVLITKQAAGKAKIDPLIAALNAAMLMARNPTAAGGKSYASARPVAFV